MKKICYFLFFLLNNPIFSQTVSLEEYSTDNNWLIGFEYAPEDDRIYTIQKNGFIKICNADGSIEPIPFLDISSKVNNGLNNFNNEQGLLGLAFHPDYQSNGYCYVFYNEIGTGDVIIARFERRISDPDQLDPNSEQLIMTWPHPQSNHVGGCIKFGKDGCLYIASGDGGGAGDPERNSQNLMNYFGKLLRINVDSGLPYSIPPDNPFTGSLSANDEIWAYGLRNPWRFSFDKKTGDLWIADVGQNEREEIDFQVFGVAGGQNFGWSCKEGSLPFNNDQCFPGAVYTDPIYEYDHELADGNCSISGGVVYRGTEYADLYGKYIFTDFCSGRIWALPKNGIEVGTVVEMGDFNNNDFTTLDQNENGEIFVTGFFSNIIYKIVSDDCTPVAIIENADSIFLEYGDTVELSLFANENYSYQWSRDSTLLTGDTSLNLNINEAGIYTVVVTNPENGCTNVSNEIAVFSNFTEVTIDGEIEVCENASFIYNAPFFKNATYDWNAQGGTIENIEQNEITINWNSSGAGFLSVEIFSLNGDTLHAGELDVSIFENDIEISGQGEWVTCQNENNGHIDLSVTGTGPFLNQWSNGETTEDIFNLPAGIYEVLVSNEIGCTATASFIIEAYSSPIIDLDIPISCDGYAVLPTIEIDSIVICDYEWGASNPDSVTTGTYSLTITDCFGCVYSSIIFVSTPPPLDISFDMFEPDMGQSNGSITALVENGISPYEYLWSNGATTQTVSNIPAGLYSVTVNDAVGCRQIDSILIGEILSSPIFENTLTYSISPNPFNDFFNLNLEINRSTLLSLNIIDISGKNIESLFDEKIFRSGLHPIKINADDWPKGIYFLEIILDNNKLVEKIIKE